MSGSNNHQGGCQCGAVRYETIGEPEKTAICHCRYCQTRTGSAFGVSVYFPSENVRVLSGEMKDYYFETESGRSFTTHFCTNCGTNVLWNIGAFPELTGVAGGTFDPPTFWYDVKREVFTRSRAPFIHTDIDDQSDTSAAYAPVNTDSGALSGG